MWSNISVSVVTVCTCASECLNCGVGQLFYWRHAYSVLVSSNVLRKVANQLHATAAAIHGTLLIEMCSNYTCSVAYNALHVYITRKPIASLSKVIY